jgi:hypothetical protein
MNILNPSDWNTEFYDSKMTSWVNTNVVMINTYS